MLMTPALVAVSLAPCPPQEPAKTAEPAPAQVKQLSDSDARAAVKAFKKHARNKKVRLADRVKAVEELGSASHKLLVTPLVKAVRADKSLVVRKTAAAALGHQPAKQTRPQLLKLLDEKRAPEVLAVLIDSLSSAGYHPRDWKTIERLFEKDFGEKYVAVQQSVLRLAVAHEEKQSWRLLSRHLDEPMPVDVDAPDNPPAEYWERRWKAWRIWRADVKEALFALTGQRFSSQKETKLWIKKNGARLGLK